MKKENCVFCNLDKEKIIRETENTVTILSNPYLMKGHCLVIPKKHYEKFSEIPEDIRLELINKAINVGDLLIEKLNATGVDIKQNYRPFLVDGKYKRDHLHIHVIPRWLEDKLYSECQVYEKNVFTDLNSELAEELMEKLR